jgi:predicted alpha/beta hydrolase
VNQNETAGTPCTLTARDGTALQARLFEPVGLTRDAVQVAGGLGIPQRFYASFATWLAARGYRVMTFDLRGMGLSRPPGMRSLRGLDADMLTWTRQDFSAAVHALSDRSGGQPIALIGHSLGGLVVASAIRRSLVDPKLAVLSSPALAVRMAS